jgi:signal peptidase I
VSDGHAAVRSGGARGATASAGTTHSVAGVPSNTVSSSTDKVGASGSQEKVGGRAPARSKGKRGGADKSSRTTDSAKSGDAASGASGDSTPSSTPNPTNGVPFEVKTVAMEPTYESSTTVYYDPTQVHPQIGQVIIYYLPVGVEEGECASQEVGGRACAVAVPGLTHILSIGRVVGLPGETIAISYGHVIRNGQPVSEPNIASCGQKEPEVEPGCEYPTAITVPPESYYVLGDKRAFYEGDSRGFGAVTQAAVVGTVLES